MEASQGDGGSNQQVLEGCVQLREYQPGDFEAMYRLDLVCFTESFQFDRRTMKEVAEAPSAIVVIHDRLIGQMAAFIVVHLEGAYPDRYAYIVTIDVAPECRRLGIGSELLLQAEFQALQAGASRIGLHVAIENTGAVDFYERRLYQRRGIAKRFYREAGLDAFVYTKDLSVS